MVENRGLLEGAGGEPRSGKTKSIRARNPQQAWVGCLTGGLAACSVLLSARLHGGSCRQPRPAQEISRLAPLGNGYTAPAPWTLLLNSVLNQESFSKLLCSHFHRWIFFATHEDNQRARLVHLVQ